MRIALGIEYDGSAFCGWQSQPQRCSVQDAVEDALGSIAGHRVAIVAAGRTDSGVHALGQVVHFDTASIRPDIAWVRGTNSALPKGVGVLWARQVADGFHARFAALERSYVYVLLNRPVRPAVLHGRVGWFHRPLDLAAMREGAAYLVGLHDFSAFRAAECQAHTPVRDLRALDLERRGDFVCFNLRANAFLHRMVRNLVGALVYVGKGDRRPEWMGELLEGRDRTRSAPTFSPDGLYLSDVRYDASWELPQVAHLDPSAGWPLR